MKTAFSIAAVICLSVFCAAAQSRVALRLAAETVVETDTITLGDVAQISGDGEKAKRIKAVSLGYAPNIGATRELSREKILLAISAVGYAPSEVSLESPPIVRIRRAGQEISQNQIREAVEKAILNQLADEKIESRIIRLDVPEKIYVPVGAVDIQANISNVQNIFAPFTVAVEIRVKGSVFRRLPANVEIEACAEIFVAARELATNTNISKTDVRLEKRRLEKPLVKYLRETEKLRGQKLIKNLSGGAEITTDALVAETLIRSGDLVRIVGRMGGLQITVNGEARTNGKIGDRIAVKNLQSNLIIQATVVDEGLVKVFF